MCPIPTQKGHQNKNRRLTKTRADVIPILLYHHHGFAVVTVKCSKPVHSHSSIIKEKDGDSWHHQPQVEREVETMVVSRSSGGSGAVEEAVQ